MYLAISPLLCFGQQVLNPLIIMGALYVSCALNHESFGNDHYVLMVLACFVSLAVYGYVKPNQAWQRGSFYLFACELLSGWAITILSLMVIWEVGELPSSFRISTLVTWSIVTPLSILAFEFLLQAYATTMLADYGRKSAVIVGSNNGIVEFANKCREQRQLRINILGFFEDRKISRTPVIDSLGGMEDVVPYVRDHRVKFVFISHPMSAQPRIRKLTEELLDTAASIYFVPDITTFEAICPRVDYHAGIPFFGVCESPFVGWNELIKRTSDVVISSTLLTLLSPLIATVAIAVKITSSGPVIFKQRRYGLYGESILVYKFRSMKVIEDGSTIVQARAGDPRLTFIGSFLRRTSLDELPQLVNVLQGRMSVVGPRPHAVAHNETYRRLIRGYMLRHKIRPGITGWAQVHGLRGETDTVEKMEARVRCDLEYVRNWSLWLDLWIIVRTVGVVLGRENAH